MSTMALEHPQLSLKKTRSRVEGLLESCRLYMQIGYYPGMEAKTTGSYNLTQVSRTNTFHSSTESAAQCNVDEERRRQELVERVLEAVDRLSSLESKIIRLRYLKDDDALDYLIWNEINLSERKYYRVKAKAFYKLGLALGVAVYEE